MPDNLPVTQDTEPDMDNLPEILNAEDIPLLDNLTVKHPKINISKAHELRQQGLTYKDIATFFDCTKQAVHQALQPYLDRTQQVQLYKDNRADILADIQLQLLSNIDTKRLKKAPLGALTLSYAQLYDKERVEQGKSTANVNIHAVVAAIKAQEGEE